MSAIYVKESLQEITELIHKGEIQQAENLCLESLGKSPGKKKLLKKLAEIREIKGNLTGARTHLEYLRAKYPRDISLLIEIERFYLRNYMFAEAKEILEEINIIPKSSEWSQKQEKKANIIFNAQIRNYRKVEKLSRDYITLNPNDPFGYSCYLQAILQLLPDNLTQLLNSLESTIGKKDLPLFLYKQILKKQHKFYSLKSIADSEEESKKAIEQLIYLLLFNGEDSAINSILEEIFAFSLSKSELGTLLFHSQKHQLLESEILKYVAANPQWLDYHKLLAIAKTIEIVRQSRKLKADSTSTKIEKFPVPIDVVYTWCDLEDPIFLEKLKIQSGFDPAQTNNPSQSKHRYTNNSEIKLSLISLFRYFSAVNRVYIVTNQQRFNLDFLTIEQREKINFIDHAKIIPTQYVRGEVFNSNIIETFLWNIPNLQEHYLYFNDDVILGDYLKPHHLFSNQGKACGLLRPRFANKYQGEFIKLANYVRGEVIPPMISRENAFEQFKLLNNRESYLIDIHQGVFLLKSESQKAFYKYLDLWQQDFFRENIRGQKSIFSVLIYVLESILSNKQVLGDYYEYCRRSITFNGGLNEEKVRYIKEVKPLFYCVNQIPDRESREYLTLLIEDLSASKPQLTS